MVTLVGGDGTICTNLFITLRMTRVGGTCKQSYWTNCFVTTLSRLRGLRRHALKESKDLLLFISEKPSPHSGSISVLKYWLTKEPHFIHFSFSPFPTTVPIFPYLHTYKFLQCIAHVFTRPNDYIELRKVTEIIHFYEEQRKGRVTQVQLC